MSCLLNPSLCGREPFVLRGPIALPPRGGWKIQNLPEKAIHLQTEWGKNTFVPTSSKTAWAHLLNFLSSNGFPTHLDEIHAESIEQWCSPDPTRCPEYSPSRTYLPWATQAWEDANIALLAPEDPVATLMGALAGLTQKINGRDGCPRCAKRWTEYVLANPVTPPDDVIPRLRYCRMYLVAAHNHTRENAPAVSYDEVAEKFNWR